LNRVLAMASAGTFAVAAIAGGCTWGHIPKSHAVLPPARGTHLAVPFEAQRGQWCGPAALASVYRYYGSSATMEQVAARVYDERLKGSLNLLLALDASEQGYRSTMRKGNWDLLRRCLESGIPVIAQLRASGGFHYVVVTGYDPATDSVSYHDGREADREDSRAAFMRQWDGVDNCAIIVWPKERDFAL
jgi:ABC-type bacteriocin/lantibiotic exporter with double-glycine peptidase domain